MLIQAADMGAYQLLGLGKAPQHQATVHYKNKKADDLECFKIIFWSDLGSLMFQCTLFS